jgi:hypothetical protein
MAATPAAVDSIPFTEHDGTTNRILDAALALLYFLQQRGELKST